MNQEEIDELLLEALRRLYEEKDISLAQKQPNAQCARGSR